MELKKSYIYWHDSARRTVQLTTSLPSDQRSKTGRIMAPSALMRVDTLEYLSWKVSNYSFGSIYLSVSLFMFVCLFFWQTYVSFTVESKTKRHLIKKETLWKWDHFEIGSPILKMPWSWTNKTEKALSEDDEWTWHGILQWNH